MNQQLAEQSRDILLWEYREVATNHRFYVGLRFVIAAFAGTLQSALLKLYSDALEVVRNTEHAIVVEIFGFPIILGGHPLAMTVVGIVSMLAIFFMERRNINRIDITMVRGKELEFRLGLPGGQYSRLRESPGLALATYTWSISIIYSIIFGLWFFLFVLNSIDLYERRLP